MSKCQRIEFIEGQDVDITFSMDTLYFDTVFASLGSATRSIKIYNHEDKFVLLDRVYLDGESMFYLNVNGEPGNAVEDIEIPPNDSIYLFVEVTVDPDQDISQSPFVVEEALRIEVGSKTREIILQAWGQNANYFFGGREQRGQITGVVCRGGGEVLWNDPRPYVIFGRVFIDSCILRITAGTRIHFHGGRVDGNTGLDGLLCIGPAAKLIIDGTAEEPVLIRGTRLEPEYINRPGQYAGLCLLPGSKGNIIRHTHIQEGQFGVVIDSAQLCIESSVIRSTAAEGIRGRAVDLEMTNCIVESNGLSNITLLQGGRVDMRYCTLSNFGASNGFAILGTNCFSFTDTCNKFDILPLSLQVTNSILATSQDDAIALFQAGEEVPLDYRFDHCLVKLSDDYIQELENPDDHLTNTQTDIDFDALFEGGRRARIYTLDSLSVATGLARPLPDVPVDIDDYMRDIEDPDIGAYENRFR